MKKDDLRELERQAQRMGDRSAPPEARAALEQMAGNYREQAERAPDTAFGRQLRTVCIGAAAVLAIYFPVAYAVSSPPPIPPTLDALMMSGITRFGRDRTAHMFLFDAPSLARWADDDFQNQHSPVVVYENDKPLGPAHSAHHEIETIGLGRYAHWKGFGVMFSTSDNTDPRYNGRTYWLVLPSQ
jgi:hypothetical protein